MMRGEGRNVKDMLAPVTDGMDSLLVMGCGLWVVGCELER